MQGLGGGIGRLVAAPDMSLSTLVMGALAAWAALKSDSLSIYCIISIQIARWYAGATCVAPWDRSRHYPTAQHPRLGGGRSDSPQPS